MKTLMTTIAALAIASAVNAQVSQCSITSDCGDFTKGYDVVVRTVHNSNGTEILNRRTGEVLESFECDGPIRIRCASTGNLTPSTPSSDTPRTTSTVVRRTARTSITRSTSSSSDSSGSTSTSSSSTRRGFPASAAIGLP